MTEPFHSHDQSQRNLTYVECLFFVNVLPKTKKTGMNICSKRSLGILKPVLISPGGLRPKHTGVCVDFLSSLLGRSPTSGLFFFVGLVLILGVGLGRIPVNHI